MEWIKLSDRKPERDMLCYVTNERKGQKGLYNYLAFYYKDSDLFIFYNDGLSNLTVPVDVTHWFELPS